MAFIMENIGYIILGLCGLGLLSSAGGDCDQAEDDDTAWFYSKENACGPNYEGI